MDRAAQSVFYGLSIFVVGTAAFVMHPTQTPELASWQKDIFKQVNSAWRQTIGDQPWFGEVQLVYEGVNDFYEAASSETIAILDQPWLNEDVMNVYSQIYYAFADSIGGKQTNDNGYVEAPLPAISSNFMTEDPIYNIVPYREVVRTIETGDVAGAMIDTTLPVNATSPWVTIRDNATSQLYCLAIYNGTINKYLGSCKNDYQ